MSPTIKLAIVLGGTLLVTGCAYDYAQHTDRVGYSAGNAVKANMAMQTTNPAKDSMYNTKGLGKDGTIDPAAGTTTTTTP